MAKICEVCGKEITGAVLTADGGTFHPECFKCDECGNLLKGPFIKKDNKRICQDCTPKVVCARCGKPIEGGVMKAGDKTYHPDCFTCEGCDVILSSGFFKLGDKIVCKKCSDQGQAPVSNYTCRRCKEPIFGRVIFGDKKDPFHEECFTCEECGCKLDTFVIDESRKFSYQEARYVCEPCYDKSIKEPEVSDRKCCVCNLPCLPDDSSLHLLDGYSLHWACFKCCDCGKQEEPGGETTVKRLLRAKVMAVKQGTYRCDPCQKKAFPDTLGPAPHVKIIYKALHGYYVGKLEANPGHHKNYAIKLMEGGKCWLDCSTATPTSSASWHAEGTYSEEPDASGRVKAIKVTIVAAPSGEGPVAGQEFVFTTEKGDPHDILVCEGVRCEACLGVPDYEVKQMLKTPEKTVAPKPVAVTPVKDVPTEVPKGCYSLEQLQDASQWKLLPDIEAGERETYLSDAAFEAVFGKSKSEFAKMPKWKKDQEKKKYALF